jgi:glucosyl-3-phosphoglycerate phosphatase
MPGTELILVRHGESIGNVAREEAESSGAPSIQMPMRDADVPLSDVGVEQARAVGRWLAADPDRLPDTVWSSPYLRARQTTRTALAELTNPPAIRQDERIRDRELGVLDLLTKRGVISRFPDEAERRSWLGKFYYRPPGGESWADLVLRIRAFLSDLDRTGHGRQLIVSHDAVILLFRYVCEQLDEERLFEIARSGSVTNASVSRLVREDGEPGWRTAVYNDNQHLEAFGAQTTEHPGEVDAAR